MPIGVARSFGMFFFLVFLRLLLLTSPFSAVGFWRAASIHIHWLFPPVLLPLPILTFLSVLGHLLFCFLIYPLLPFPIPLPLILLSLVFISLRILSRPYRTGYRRW